MSDNPQHMIIKCPQCEEEFEEKQYTETLEDGTERHYLMCPHCGEQRTFFYVDSVIRRLRSLQQSARLRGDAKELNRWTKRIKKRTKTLKAKYEGREEKS